MKINDSNLNSVTTSTNAVQTPSGGPKANAANRGEGRGDRVQLSDLSSHLRIHAGGGPERDAHVAKLAVTYQTGAYRVSADSVSHSLVSDALQSR